MSNIYIQEPPTSGKVLLKTSVGDIDIELWSRECPKACRNFIQLCMEGYYNGTVFHRLVKGFIVQGGDPEGNGHGGESIYGEPFKDEFHSRLRYTRRGLLGMANSGKNDNGSQFFFTLAATPELQNQNTLFGKVTGDTLYNMLKLEEGMVDQDERPMYLHKIIKSVILNNPFEDIVPREFKKEESVKPKNKKKEKGVKNYGLLSFGDEAEEDEIEATEFIQKSGAKIKSTHDVLDDPKLSKEAVKIDQVSKELNSDEQDDDLEERKKIIRDKLKLNVGKSTKILNNKKEDEKSDESDEDVLTSIEKLKEEEKKKKVGDIRKEINKLKKDYVSEKKKTERLEEETTKKEEAHTQLVQEYLSEKEKYKSLSKSLPKKGSSRESHTMELLASFKKKLITARESINENTPSTSVTEDNIDAEIQGDNWLSHELHFETQTPILAKDASTKGDDWYDVFDPRNPLNKRKRQDDHENRSKSSRTKS